jgi:EpsI family protein
MTTRRNLIVGGACVASAAAVYAMKPRRHVALLGAGERLENLVPMTLPGWTGQDTGDPLALNQEGTLSAKLYNQLVARLYTDTARSAQIMVLLAYGSQQSDDLQLHRPEICYPAFGFSLERNEPTQVPLEGRARIPARRLIAQNADGREYIVYWSRLGEYLPQSGGEQREARFVNAFDGIIPDGILCRFSTRGPDADAAWSVIYRFIDSLITGIRADKRAILIGTERAALLRKPG